MKLLLTLPILIPLATAAVCLTMFRKPYWQRIVSLGGACAHLGSSAWLLHGVHRSGIQVVQIGGWQAPFGITLVSDLFSAIMLVITGLMGVSVLVYSLIAVDHGRERFGYYPLFHLLLLGVSGSFLTGDLFNLYVWFEVMLISSFALLALGGEPAQIEGSIKYVTLNLVASALLLTAIGMVYGLTGSLNMAALALKFDQPQPTGIASMLATLFLIAFGVKAAVFPLFFWLPASYHTCPVPVSAIFAGLLTKVGVYVLIRTFTLIFVHDTGYTHRLLLLISMLTMITGVLGALAQNEFRRILSFHIVSQIGYMTLGLALYTPLALAGSVFYIVHHIIVKTNLFLVSGVARSIGGSFELKALGGLHALRPVLGVLFLIPALSLAGLPPLSGFFAKLALVQAALSAQEYLAAGAALGVSLLTLLSMMKIWNEAFWKPAPHNLEYRLKGERALLSPIVALALITVTIGLCAGPLFELSETAAGQLLHREGYIQAVLGDRP
ncbi:MAG: Na+/H+ antiporter subunit D [Bryobacteraceae bacterium]